MYGALNLNSFTLAAMAVVAIVTLFVAVPMYLYLSKWWGMLPHLVCITATAILLVTWLTALSSPDWRDAGPFPVIGALIVLAIAAVGPPLAAWYIDEEVLS